MVYSNWLPPVIYVCMKVARSAERDHATYIGMNPAETRVPEGQLAARA